MEKRKRRDNMPEEIPRDSWEPKDFYNAIMMDVEMTPHIRLFNSSYMPIITQEKETPWKRMIIH